MQEYAHNDRFILYCLSHLDSISAAGIRKLKTKVDVLSDIVCMNTDKLINRMELTEHQAADISDMCSGLDKMYDNYMKMSDKGVRYITSGDDAYPERLRNIYNPPITLYLKGELPVESMSTVAIVGSRAASSYGMEMTRYIAGRLAKKGIGIISGMATGIDGCAHRSAIEAGAKTYAILAGGVDVCYPRENFYLYNEITSGCGAVISEYPMGTASHKWRFPMRNRIISGMADIVIVMEAGDKSGSLITVDHAIEQGKDVFAMPGRINDRLSRGCNRLISYGANILTSPDDVIECLGMIREKKLVLCKKDINALANCEKKVYSCLDLSPKAVDIIIEETGMQIGKLMTVLLDLELRGYIKQISGGYYIRAAS